MVQNAVLRSDFLNGFEPYHAVTAFEVGLTLVTPQCTHRATNGVFFSCIDDPGTAGLGAKNEILAQLSGGAETTDSLDITYGNPRSLWNMVIRGEFHNAVRSASIAPSSREFVADEYAPPSSPFSVFRLSRTYWSACGSSLLAYFRFSYRGNGASIQSSRGRNGDHRW